jgi:hypothetical protein
MLEPVLALIDKPGRYAKEDPLLMVGDHVKLGLPVEGHPQFGAEWCWFEVRSVAGGLYSAALAHETVYATAARPGDLAVFEGKHIYSVVRDSELRPAGEREEVPS